ncbi:MAG TPA: UpxY family transcription antiterminator [Bacteroidia bacterium]|jgi:transcriptional antiterminator NusG|nr:UpxY family transcription antiterminator [Bacteroidia bacterium]
MVEKEKNWHALYVASRQEKKVLKRLEQKNIETYLPILKTMKQWSDRKKMVELPLLNGYIFVRITNLENEKTIQTPGVVNFVRAEGKIAKVRDIEIERLKQLIDLGYQMELNGVKRNYREGDKVKITSGALKNVEGFVVENKEGRYIDVLLESIGQSIRVKLPEEILIPIK